MTTLINQGTLFYTPEGGMQNRISSNITTTALNITYGLEVSHAATPTTFLPDDIIQYTVLLRNTGTGALYNPFVTVEVSDDALDYVEGSTAAFLFAGGEVNAIPVTVTQNSPVTFSTDVVLPAGGFIYLIYSAVVTNDNVERIVTTAIGGANQGSENGPTITDRDTTTITRTLLSIVKTAPETAEVGDTINYRFTITNSAASAIVLDRLSDQLPDGFAFTGVSLSINGTNVPLEAGEDYAVGEEGLFVLNPAGAVTVPAGATALLTLTGVVTL